MGSYPLRDEIRSRFSIDIARAHLIVAQVITLLGQKPRGKLTIDAIRIDGDVVSLDDSDALIDPNPVASVGEILFEVLGGRPYSRGATLDRPGLPPAVGALIERFTDPMNRLSLDTAHMELGVLNLGPSYWVTPRGRRDSYETEDRREAELLDALRAQPTDSATRLVYADYLEEKTATARASYVRTYSRDDAPLDEANWRAVVGRAPIRCQSSGCPKDWDALAPTRFDDIRNCTVCSTPVFYAIRAGDGVGHGFRGERIAVDPGVPDAEIDSKYAHGRMGRVGPTMNPPPPTPFDLPLTNPPPPLPVAPVLPPTNPIPMPTQNPPIPRSYTPTPTTPRPGLFTRVRRWFGRGNDDDDGI